MTKLTKKKRDKVGSILQAWGLEMKGKAPVMESNPDSIDVQALNKMETTKNLISILKGEGVKDSKELMDNGFVPAAMILRF